MDTTTNKFQSYFDLIIIGTGLIESVISAAASRIGKTVLQIDSNDFYGGHCASFNLQTFHNLSNHSLCKTNINSTNNFNSKQQSIGNSICKIKNFNSKWHISEKIEQQIDNESGEETSSEIEIENTYSQEEIVKDSRRFNIDLLPKLHYCRGDFIELLISSNICRYSEFRSVSRILTVLNDELIIVPCSRNDVFANNKISMLEKRILMKLLTSIQEEENQNLLIDNSKSNKTFYSFLKDNHLTEKLATFVIYAIAQCTRETSCIDGIKYTKKFLNSLGRFGKTPFLLAMYGSGETPQAFCRLSAVFGGTFALNQKHLTTLELNKEESVVIALKNNDESINAKHFVVGFENIPITWAKSLQIDYISRAVFLTNRSIMASEQEHLTLLMYPAKDEKSIVTIIEMGSATGTCPKDFYLVHFIGKQLVNPEDDFKHIVHNLFGNINDPTKQTKPMILWSSYFSLPYTVSDKDFTDLPSNLKFCRGTDADLDYDSCIEKAKEIFHSIYSDDVEFLPRAPDPEDIIFNDSEED